MPLTITYDAGGQRDPRQIGDWVPITNLAVGYDIGVGSGLRSVVTTGAYRLFVYDGASKLDDVTRRIHLGSTQATAMDPGGFIYTGYALGGDVDRYSLVSFEDGVGYDIKRNDRRRRSRAAPRPLPGSPSREACSWVSRGTPSFPSALS